MNAARTLFFVGLAVSITCFSLGLAAVPNMINYQGKLTTFEGELLSGYYSMEFSIYEYSVGGTPLWTETQSSVKVEEGLFSVQLGSITAIPESVFDGSLRFLGVKVGTDAEMTPRRPLVSVAYAYKADNDGDWTVSGNDIYTTVSGNVGIGTVTIPHGGVGVAKFAMEGADASSTGPHLQFTTGGDDYPLMQIMNWTHDNVGLLFDSYYDGSDYRSSYSSSNFLIFKNNDRLKFMCESSQLPGDIVTWNNGITLTRYGRVGIGADPLSAGPRLTVGQGQASSEVLAIDSGDGAGETSHLIFQRGGVSKASLFATDSNDLRIKVYDTNDIIFESPSDTEVMRIDGSEGTVEANNITSNAMTSDSYAYASSQVRYYSVAPSDFIPASPDINDVLFRYKDIIVQGASAVQFFAPVHLPHGATITEVCMYFEDGSNMWDFHQVDFAGSSTAIIDNQYRGCVSVTLTVDNQNYSYQLWTWGHDAGDLIYGARITYTIDTPLP